MMKKLLVLLTVVGFASIAMAATYTYTNTSTDFSDWSDVGWGTTVHPGVYPIVDMTTMAYGDPAYSTYAISGQADESVTAGNSVWYGTKFEIAGENITSFNFTNVFGSFVEGWTLKVTDGSSLLASTSATGSGQTLSWSGSGVPYIRIFLQNTSGETQWLWSGNGFAVGTAEITTVPKATTPSPADGATGVSVDADLSWLASSLVLSHDVYFGTSETAVANAQRLAGDINGDGPVDIDDLIVFVDQWMTNPGAVNPSADIVYNQYVNMQDFSVLAMDWGLNAAAEFKGNQTGTSFDPGTLQEGTTYYWRIDEVNGSEPESPWTGEVWQFTTASLKVVLMADPQIGASEDSLANVEGTMADIETQDYDFMAVLGDLVQLNNIYYPDYEDAVLDAASKPVYSVPGNSDYIAGGYSGYLSTTGLPLYYTVYEHGIRFIFLYPESMSGSTNHLLNLGSTQLAWLEDELESDTNATTVIFFHAPLMNTTFNSHSSVEYYLYETPDLIDLFDTYSNVKAFASGHVHGAFGWVDSWGRSDYYMLNNVLCIHIPGSFNMAGYGIMEIRSDGIFTRARTQTSGVWGWRTSSEYNYPCETTYAD